MLPQMSSNLHKSFISNAIIKLKNEFLAPRVFSVYTLMKIHNRGKFDQCSICNCLVKNLQSFAYRFSIHEIALFRRFLGAYFLNMVQYCRNSQQRQYSSKHEQSLKNFLITRLFMEKGWTQSQHFWSCFDPSFSPADGQNRKK